MFVDFYNNTVQEKQHEGEKEKKMQHQQLKLETYWFAYLLRWEASSFFCHSSVSVCDASKRATITYTFTVVLKNQTNKWDEMLLWQLSLYFGNVHLLNEMAVRNDFYSSWAINNAYVTMLLEIYKHLNCNIWFINSLFATADMFIVYDCWISRCTNGL